MTNDFSVWFEEAPVLNAGGSGLFDIWFENEPVLDWDVADALAAIPRRRACIL